MTTNPLKPLLDCIAPARTDPILIEANGDVLTGRDLTALADTLAGDVTRLGLDQGARVAVVGDDTLENAFQVLCLAFLTSVIVLNRGLPANQLRQIMAESGADCLLSDAQNLQLASQITDTPIVFGRGQISADAPMTRSQQHPVGLVLMTSGSTGLPKRVPLRPDQVLLSAQNIAATLELGPQDRAVSALPIYHVGALVDQMLAPMIGGGTVVAALDKSPAALYAAVTQGGGTWAQMVPTMLFRCLADLTEADLLRMGVALRFVRMVSSDLPPQLQQDAERQLGGTPLVQMYGMTETAGQIASNPVGARGRKLGSVGPAAGAEIAILAPDGTPVAPQQEGEICLRGPTVMAGYEGADPTPRYGDWLRSGDLGRLDRDGYLIVTGRLKEIINRGGEKISPVTVERAALTCNGVQEAVAFALPHKTLGEQVGLAVVADPGVDVAAINAQLSGRLAEYEMPRRITRLDALPKLGSGKVDRRTVRELAQAVPTSAKTAPSDTPTQRAVADLWLDTLKTPVAGVDQDFFDAGGDSLSAAEFLMALEARLGINAPPNLLFDHPRFDQLVDAVAALTPTDTAHDFSPEERFIRATSADWQGDRAGASGLWVARNLGAKGVPVFFAVNGAHVARTFSATFGANRPHYIVRSLYASRYYRDRNDRKIAEILASDIMALRPTGRLVLGGVCRGASTLKRAADLLIAQGRKVDLFLCVDDAFHRAAPYPVLHLWTDSLWHSPYGLFEDPKRGLARFHSAGALAFHVPGDHGHALTRKTLKGITGDIDAAIEGAPIPIPPPPPDLGFEARKGRRRARARLRAPWIVAQGAHVTLRAEMRNISPDPWPPTAESGLRVFATVTGWRRMRKQPFYPWRKRTVIGRIAHGQLTVTVPPQGRTSSDFTIQMPRRRGIYLVRVSMVDEGITHFLGRFRSAKVRPVIVW